MTSQEQKNSSQISNIFLRQFIKELLSNALVVANANSPLPVIKEVEINLEKQISVKDEYSPPAQEINLEIKQKNLPPVPSVPVPKKNMTPRLIIQNRKIVPRTFSTNMQQVKPVIHKDEEMLPSITAREQKVEPITAHQQPAESNSIKIQGMDSVSDPSVQGFDRLLPILRDPAVLGIECTGPDKPILVNNAGRIQPARLSLSKEEIDKVLEEISDKTRIPLITGIFKAAFDRYIISAIVSEYSPSKFTIEKKIMTDLNL